MYIPSHNAETRTPVLHALMRAHPLAALVTLNASGLVASHIPVMLHREEGEFGTLRAHISRANTQWRELVSTTEALAIFSGRTITSRRRGIPAPTRTGKRFRPGTTRLSTPTGLCG